MPQQTPQADTADEPTPHVVLAAVPITLSTGAPAAPGDIVDAVTSAEHELIEAGSLLPLEGDALAGASTNGTDETDASSGGDQDQTSTSTDGQAPDVPTTEPTGTATTTPKAKRRTRAGTDQEA